MQQIIKFSNLKPVSKPHLKGKFCSVPFTDISVDPNGDFTMCKCQLHMPFVVGNAKTNSIEQSWNSELANAVRNSVLQGTFDYCSWKCPGLKQLESQVPSNIKISTQPTWINISNDLSCNLKCPSCREHVIIEKDPVILEKQNQLIDEIVSFKNSIVVNPCNNGEPLVSPSTMYLLKNIDQMDLKHVKLYLSTNGTLIYRYRDLIASIGDRITGIAISIDAATEGTYQKVRGELWQDLMQGIQWLFTLDQPIHTTARFVVQGKNYHEMRDFVTMTKNLGFREVHFQLIRDWGHWSDQWWDQNKLSSEEMRCVQQESTKLKEEFGNFIIFDSEFLI